MMLGLLANQLSHAQAIQPIDSLSQQLRRYSQRGLTEQLYLHLDRPAYVAGDRLWFKAYAVDGVAKCSYKWRRASQRCSQWPCIGLATQQRAQRAIWARRPNAPIAVRAVPLPGPASGVD
jgi:hypothetical protein